MRHRRTRKQRGSAYIYEGSYGCAFGRPPLKCKTEATRRGNNQISKVMNPTNAVAEVRDARKFSQIDPASKYFLWPSNNCPLDTANIKPTNNPERCRGFQVTNANKRYQLVFSENGGKNLEHIIPDPDKWAAFFNSLSNLFEGLELAHKNSIAHVDIAPRNIVSKLEPDGSYKTRYIDFGLSTATDSISPKTMELLGVNYACWPFEIRFYNKTYYQQTWLKGNKQAEVTKWYTHLNNYMKKHLPLHTYWHSSGKPRFAEDEFGTVLKGLNLSDSKTAIEKLDVYSLGMALSEVYYRLTKHKQLWSDEAKLSYLSTPLLLILKNPQLGHDTVDWHAEVQQHISKPFGDLIYEMTHILPDRRPSPQNALLSYQAILPSIKRLYTEQNVKKYFSNSVQCIDLIAGQPHEIPLPASPPSAR